MASSSGFSRHRARQRKAAAAAAAAQRQRHASLSPAAQRAVRGGTGNSGQNSPLSLHSTHNQRHHPQQRIFTSSISTSPNAQRKHSSASAASEREQQQRVHSFVVGDSSLQGAQQRAPSLSERSHHQQQHHHHSASFGGGGGTSSSPFLLRNQQQQFHDTTNSLHSSHSNSRKNLQQQQRSTSEFAGANFTHHHQQQHRPSLRAQEEERLLFGNNFLYFKPDFGAIEQGTISQMENRSRIRPVQLFAQSSSNPNVLKLNKSGLNAVLGHASIANRKVVVISVTGAYRKGKSFLLNFFLDYLYKLQYTQKNQELELEEWITDDDIVEGFLYKPGTKRSTAGIWIWAEPILIDVPNGDRYAVILMDCQGCLDQSVTTCPPNSGGPSASSATAGGTSSSNNNAGNTQMAASNTNGTFGNGNSTNGANGSGTHLPHHNSSQHHHHNGGGAGAADHHHHPAVLALSTMLSSVQCYNMGECIPDEAIQLLSFFTDYGKLATTEAKDLGKPFQRLAFIVRDFKLTDELIYGIEGGNHFLEKVLRLPEGTDRRAPLSKINEVRKSVRHYFDQGVNCYLMPHPGPKVADQNANFRGHVKDVKQLFRDEVKRLVESMLAPNVIRPKMLNGKPVTVRKFVDCVREYARIFDCPELPEPRAILNSNLQLVCVDYAVEAKLTYCRAMDRATRSSRMMAEKKLLEAHIKHGIKALNIYDRCPKIDSGEVRNQNLARLQEAINHELERYQRLNEEKRVTTCASAMLACGDSPLLGLGLGGAASGTVAATVVTLQMGVVSAGIVAIPVSLTALFGIWIYVTLKPTVKSCLGLEKDN